MQKIADDVRRKLMESRAYKDAEKRLDFWAVVLLGTGQRVPRTWGDNEGVWPVRVGITQDLDGYVGRVDIEAGSVHEHVLLDRHWTNSRRHAARLKARLEDLLPGRLRHNWRNISDPDIEWPIILGEALRVDGEVIETFDDDAKFWRTLAEARRGRHGG